MRIVAFIVATFMSGTGLSIAAEPKPESPNQPVQVRSVSVNGQPVVVSTRKTLRLPATPKNVAFNFAPGTNCDAAPLRLRYKLEGYDDTWHEVPGQMTISVRFVDEKLEQVSEMGFKTVGQSEGWTGTLEASAFVHHQEAMLVPPQAKALWLAMSSAGPPNAVGIYAITNLLLTRASEGEPPSDALLKWTAESKGELAGTEWMPVDWVKDGLRLGIAKTAPAGPGLADRALVLVDNDPDAHAEWTTRKVSAVPVAPGERLLLAWDEAHSIGLAGPAQASYPDLPAGFYRFRVTELSLAGVPGEAEASIAFEVPLSFWKTPWSWGILAVFAFSVAAGAYRYTSWRQMRLELARLESQRALEHERLRIARDIHDDFGARVTQISLLSGLAQSDHGLPEKARADFNTISGMARELVSALYETVWAVNPENDNLDALGNYLCQMVDNLCDKAQLRRRLRVADLPRDVQVPSNVRHDLVMAVKEAVNNVLKHAKATELSVFVTYENETLTIRVQDNGRGFDPAAHSTGNGLANMQRRLEQLGGNCTAQSEAGQGTTVSFCVRLVPRH